MNLGTFSAGVRLSAVLSLALFAVVAASPVAVAGKVVNLGKGPDGWLFNQETEKNGIIICRAIRKKGGRDDIMAMRTNGEAYVSVIANGMNGNFPDSFVVPLNEQGTGLQWDMTAGANNIRMWFVIPSAGIDMIAAKGGYEYYVGGTEVSEKVALGSQVENAWNKVRECVVNNGG